MNTVREYPRRGRIQGKIYIKAGETKREKDKYGLVLIIIIKQYVLLCESVGIYIKQRFQREGESIKVR